MATGISKGFEEWSIHKRVDFDFFIEFNVLDIGQSVLNFGS